MLMADEYFVLVRAWLLTSIDFLLYLHALCVSRLEPGFSDCWDSWVS